MFSDSSTFTNSGPGSFTLTGPAAATNTTAAATSRATIVYPLQPDRRDGPEPDGVLARVR